MSPPVPRSVGSQPQPGFRLSQENLLQGEAGTEGKMPPPLPPLKPEWRHHMMMANNSHDQEEEEEEAIPSDSLYGTQETVVAAGSQAWREKTGRPGLSDMAHWSSHGYLARDSEQERSQDRNSGYVVLKRQGDSMVTLRSSSHQPSSLPSVPPPGPAQPENKYFSVRGYKDFTNKLGDNFGPSAAPEQELNPKYFSVDAKFLNQHADMKNKLRENLRVSNTGQQIYGGNNNSSKPLPDLPQYYQPPPPPNYPPYQRPPPPQRTEASKPTQPAKPKPAGSNLESSKQMSGSVSWLEWTQQLQAYIAWVNSQLRKRAELSAVQDLRTDLQSGEVLAQLIEIICKLFCQAF